MPKNVFFVILKFSFLYFLCPAVVSKMLLTVQFAEPSITFVALLYLIDRNTLSRNDYMRKLILKDILEKYKIYLSLTQI